MGILGELWIKLGLKDEELNKGLDKSKQKVSGFGQAIGKIGGAIAGAFTAKKIIDFGMETASLANKARGVKQAFENLNSPSLLADLRRATGGTVDDLQLMQRAVQADNFKIPLNQLATYLQFATKRANETGQSVDYLVDSIITGLGRQSVMILDNLGLSAAEIKENMKGGKTMAEAVGQMIKQQMGDSSMAIDKAATATETLSAAWTNFKLAVGQSTSPIVNNVSSGLAGYLDTVTRVISSDLSFREKLSVLFGGIGGGQQEAVNKLLNQENEQLSNVKLAEEIAQKWVSQVKTRKQAQEKLNYLLSVQSGLDENSNALQRQTNELAIAGLRKWIQKYDEERKKKSQIITQLEEEIKKKKALRETASSEKQIQEYNKEISALEEKLKVIQMTEQERKKYAKQKWSNWLSENKFKPVESDNGLKNLAGSTLYKYLSPEGRRTKELENWRKENKKQGILAVQETLQLQEKIFEASEQLNSAIQSGVAGSLNELANAIAGVNGANIGSVVKSLLTPLADAAISAGLLIMSTGKAITALKTGLKTFVGTAPMVAGAALVALGVAAKAGLAAIGSGNNGGGAGGSGVQSVTSFSGGYSAGGVNTNSYSQQASNINLTTTLKGQDILLAVQRTQQNNKR